MANKKQTGKKGGFALAPITLSEPVKATDGFTNLVETPAGAKPEAVASPKKQEKVSGSGEKPTSGESKREIAPVRTKPESKPWHARTKENKQSEESHDVSSERNAPTTEDFRLSAAELLRILDADSLDEIYELSDVLRASSLKLYAALVRLADSRGRARVKNHELMSKAGIKGIATLYKQERWLMDLKLLEKKAKPGPHDGSLYLVHKLESLPLPAEIYEKFDAFLSGLK
jgi:hypothetical protein